MVNCLNVSILFDRCRLNESFRFDVIDEERAFPDCSILVVEWRRIRVCFLRGFEKTDTNRSRESAFGQSFLSSLGREIIDVSVITLE